MIFRPARPRARPLLMAAALFLALTFLIFWTTRRDPLGGWLAVAHLRHWGYGALFASACLVAGWRATRRLLAPALPRLGERLAYAMGTGVLIFAVGVFLAGLLGLYGRAFFFAYPVALIATGGRAMLGEGRRHLRRLRPFGARLVRPRTVLEAAVAAGGLLGLVAIYLLVINPDNVGLDGRRFHLAIAEHHVAAGKVRPFVEGWYAGARPQLATWLYTWAFQAPGNLHEHVLIAAHLEWTLFLATLSGVAVLARRLVASPVALPFAGMAVFLFPALLLHDSSLAVGADHVMAFFAPILALALLRLCRLPDQATAVLLALLTAGALLTGYRAIYLAAPVALLMVGVSWWGRRELRLLAVYALTTLAATAPHWLTNLVFHGDPAYPLLHALFPSRPLHGRAAELIAPIVGLPESIRRAAPLEGLGRTVAALFSFALVSPEGTAFHGRRPIFGALFTLLLPVLLFIRGRDRGRLLLLVVITHVGLLLWCLTGQQQRALQILLPWMAAVTAALLVLAWRQLPGARAALLALVGFQLLWGADVYFIRAHAIIGDSPLKSLVDRIALGHAGRGRERLRWGGELVTIGRGELPRGTRVLVHELDVKLGLRATGIVDKAGWQGAIEYLDLDTPARVATLWRELGATHVLWRRDRGDQAAPALAREAVFQRALQLARESQIEQGGYHLASLRVAPPAAGTGGRSTRLTWMGCGDDPPLGVYTPRGLGERRRSEPLDKGALAADPARALAAVNAVIARESCGGLAPVMAELKRRFERVMGVGGLSLWIRRGEGP